MTHPEQPHPPRRSNAEYRWTGAKITAFLHALVETGSVSRAARSVGMSRQSAYRLRARSGREIAALWDEGLVFAQLRRGQGYGRAHKVTPARAR
jgi:molybdenum-dependent DNA-binding transcriptional regulator ModE